MTWATPLLKIIFNTLPTSIVETGGLHYWEEGLGGGDLRRKSLTWRLSVLYGRSSPWLDRDPRRSVSSHFSFPTKGKSIFSLSLLCFWFDPLVCDSSTVKRLYGVFVRVSLRSLTRQPTSPLLWSFTFLLPLFTPSSVHLPLYSSTVRVRLLFGRRYSYLPSLHKKRVG